MVSIPISIGELIDKLSILEIKKKNIKDSTKRLEVKKEHDLLINLSEPFLLQTDVFFLYKELLEVNSELWQIEDEIRDYEFNKKFDNDFVELARKVYKTNDKRFAIKNKINELTSSEIREIKNYKEYR